jgi:TatD DNase family protein
MPFIDSHAHIDFPQFDQDRETMLQRARDAGVELLLAVGTGPGPEQLDAALPYAQAHDWIYTSVGIHPHEAAKVTGEHLGQLEQLARHPRVIAFGEIGLDYHYDSPGRDVQQRVFGEQLALARCAKLPVIIHCREAWSDCLAILEQQWRSAALGGILHCYSGTLDQARQGMELGFLVSFAGNLTYPKSLGLREVAKALPLSSLLIETDSPYLAPQRHRGRRNEPAYVREVAETLASVRDLAVEDVAAVTAANFRRFFDLNAAASV